jgi:hypothetical protein
MVKSKKKIVKSSDGKKYEKVKKKIVKSCDGIKLEQVEKKTESEME